MIDFYTNAMSRGRIAHWMLEELGEPYTTHWVEYGAAMKSAEYLGINPMGKVPALVHEGATITECAAIVTYLAAVFPEKGLIPSGPAELAKFYRWMFFAAGPVEQAVTSKSMDWEVTEKNRPMLGFGCLDDTLNAVETALANGPWICGGQFTAVDVYLGSHLVWGMQFGTMEKRPAFEKYAEQCRARAAWRSADEINNRQMPESPPG